MEKLSLTQNVINKMEKISSLVVVSFDKIESNLRFQVTQSVLALILRKFNIIIH